MLPLAPADRVTHHHNNQFMITLDDADVNCKRFRHLGAAYSGAKGCRSSE